MIPAPHAYRQTLLVRLTGSRAIQPVISALNDLTEQRVLRIVDVRSLGPDPAGSIAAITVEHLWWSRLVRSLADAKAELVSDLETPKPNKTGLPSEEQLRQIEQLNQMRRVGTLTEAEFARAKRGLLPAEGRPQ